MRRKLTQKTVETIRPSSDRQEITDTLITSLRLVVQPSGAKSWALRYRIHGRSRKLTLGRFPALGLGEARDSARAALIQIQRGNDPFEAKRRDRPTTVADASSQFLERHASKTRKQGEAKRVLDLDVLPRIGHLPVGDVTRRHVIEILDTVVDRGSPVQANRTLALVRKLFNWCVERDFISISPAAGVRPPGRETKRTRFLSDDELAVFLGACRSMGWPFGSVFELLARTGQRLGEVAGMRRREVSGGLWGLPAERVKNAKPHQVPLSDGALRILTGAPVIGGELYFTTTGATPISGFGRAKRTLNKLMLEALRASTDDERAVIPPFTLHDLRRTAASGMARLGVQLPVIERVLNHTSGSFGGIVGVYQQHSFAEEMREALIRWDTYLDTLLGRLDKGVLVAPSAPSDS